MERQSHWKASNRFGFPTSKTLRRRGEAIERAELEFPETHQTQALLRVLEERQYRLVEATRGPTPLEEAMM